MKKQTKVPVRNITESSSIKRRGNTAFEKLGNALYIPLEEEEKEVVEEEEERGGGGGGGRSVVRHKTLRCSS